MHRRVECTLILGSLVTFAADAADWNQWHGPNRTGVTSESSGWPGGWPPTKKWQNDAKVGCSSPVIANVDGQWCVFALGNASGTDHVYCFDAETGGVIWEKTYSCPAYGANDSGYDHVNYKGPQATPTYDPATGYLYTFSCDGDLYCWNAKSSGSQVWFKDIRTTYNIQRRPSCAAGDRDEKRDYGFTSAPLILGNNIVLEVAGQPGDRTLMAFSKGSGNYSWQSAATEPRGTTIGPVLMSGNRLAVSSLDKLLIIDAGGSHNTLASYNWSVQFACNVATPAIWNDDVILTAAYNKSTTHQVRISGGSASKVRDFGGAWAVVCTPVVHGNYAYMVEGALKCLDLQNGGQKWSDGSFGQQGTCLVADGDDKVIVFGGNKLALYDCGATRNKRAEKTGILTNTPDDAWPQVALAGGYIACRDGKGQLACYSVGSAPPPPVPDPPTGVSATDGSYPDKVRVTWNSSSGATSYEVWRSATNNSGSATRIRDNHATRTYDDASATPGTTYYYWVKAKNSSGTSGFSASDAGYASVPPPPAAPTGVSASDGTYTNTVRLTWNSSSGATAYEVWRSTTNSSGSATRIRDNHTTTTYDDASVTPETTYYYWVKAKNSSGTSGFSASDPGYAHVAPETITVTAPTGGTYYGDQDVTITWTSNLTGNVRIEFTEDGSNWTVIASPLATGGSYTYRLPNRDRTGCAFRVSDLDGDPSHESGTFSITSITDGDGDRMDDAWETNHFGDLTHDGTTDTDGDGVNDLQEFWRGSDPTIAGGTGAGTGFGCLSTTETGAALALLGLVALVLVAVRSLPGSPPVRA